MHSSRGWNQRWLIYATQARTRKHQVRLKSVKTVPRSKWHQSQVDCLNLRSTGKGLIAEALPNFPQPRSWICATWTIQFTNETVNAFYDCFAFWNGRRGIAHSDSVNGVFPDIRTSNGRTWQSIAANMPSALSGEASYAASGTCIATEGERNAWIATGGSTIARILATRDGGDTWAAYDTPLVSSPTAGGISVAFRDAWHGILGGGDLASNNFAETATSDDGGRTWTLTSKPPVKGAIFCLAYVRGQCHRHVADS